MIKFNKKTKGFVLAITGICLISGGFSIPYGLTGALVSSGVMISLWGMVLCTDE